MFKGDIEARGFCETFNRVSGADESIVDPIHRSSKRNDWTRGKRVARGVFDQSRETRVGQKPIPSKIQNDRRASSAQIYWASQDNYRRSLPETQPGIRKKPGVLISDYVSYRVPTRGWKKR